MTLIVSIIILLITFYLLARIVDLFFVESLEIISKKLKLSPDIAGASFMAIGSSAPELFVAFFALFRVGEQQAMGAGTIVGSAIFNILVIVGASAVIHRATLQWQPVIRDIIFYIFAISIVLITFSDGTITLSDALIYIGIYIAYLISFKLWPRLFPYKQDTHWEEKIDKDITIHEKSLRNTKLALKNVVDKFLSLFFFNLNKRESMVWFNFIIAIILIGVISHVMVESAIVFAHGIGVSEVIISLTIIAAGTSIPDLLSSLNVAKQGKGDMAIANAIGSNIFDIAIGLGLPWLILIIFTQTQIKVGTENLYSSIILLFATVIALFFLLIAKKWSIGRWGGLFLITLYLLYVTWQILFVA